VASRSGSLSINLEDLFSMSLAVNSEEASASFSLEVDGTAVSVSGQKDVGGEFHVSTDDFAIDIVADVANNTGTLGFEFDGRNKGFYGGLEEGDQGALRFKNGNQEFGISGNVAGTAGSVSFKDGSNEFLIAADRNAGTGNLSLNFDGEGFTSDIASDTASVSFTFGGTTMSTGINADGGGGFAYDDGARSFTMFGDPASKSGKMDLNIDGNELSIATDIPNGDHSISVDAADLSFSALAFGASKEIKVAYDNYEIHTNKENNEYEVGVSLDNQSIVGGMESNEMKLQYSGNGVVAGLSEGQLVLSYNGQILEVNKDQIKLDGTDLSEIPASANFTFDQQIGDLTTTVAVNNGAYALQFQVNNSAFEIATEDFSDGAIALNVNGNSFELEKDQSQYKVTVNDILASYENGNLRLQKGEDRQFTINGSDLSLSFDGYDFTASASAFTYNDGTNSASIAEDGLSLTNGEKNLFINEQESGLNVGSSKHVYFTRSSLDFKYDNYEANFSSSESISFNDGTRSFEQSSSGMEMSEGDKSIAVIDDDGLPAIRLQNGADLIELSQSGFALEYDGRRYEVDETEFLSVEIDPTRKIVVMNNGVKYVEGSFEFAIGGDENIVELKEGSTSLALSQDQKLVLTEGIYSASLSKDLTVELSDGTRTIKLLDEDYFLNYLQGDYQFGIRGANGSTPGVDFSYDDYTFFVEGEKNSDVTVGVSSEAFGAISASVNSEKDVSVILEQSEESAFGFIIDKGNIHLITGGPAEPPTPEHLDNSPEIPAQDGPQHLDNSIAEDAGGFIRGEVNVYFDSRNTHFMMNAAVASKEPFCLNGAMALEISPGEFHLDVGTEEQQIEVFPCCSGFGGGGWLGIHNSEVDLGVFAGWRAGASVDIGSDVCGAGMTARIGAELGVRAKLDLDPFKMHEAGVWVELYAGLSVRYWCTGGSGSLTIAEALLRGDLMVYFESETRVTGSLNGSIVLLDIISSDFEMSFDTTL